jgi:hypothetical protein
MPEHSLDRIIYRYVSGRPLDGAPRTDATYLHPGTRVLTATGRASRWARLPGWKRQAVRLLAPPALASAVYGSIAAPGTAQACAAVVGGAAALRAVRSARARVRTRRFRRLYSRPLAQVVGPMAGIPDGTPPDRWLTISPELAGLAPRLARPMSPAEIWVRERWAAHVAPVTGFLPDQMMRAQWWIQGRAKPVTRRLEWFRVAAEPRPARVEIRTPSYLTAEQQAAIARAVSVKLPLGDMVQGTDQVGPYATMTWTPRRRPPAGAGLADVLAHIDALVEDSYYLGPGVDGRAGRAVVISLADDSPHIAISAGTGAGKSVLAMLVAIQVLRRGGNVLILDRKGSHRWAIGLPGVTYCLTTADQHAALIGAASLADARNTEAFVQPEDWNPGPRTLIICEELNGTIGSLRNYWLRERNSGDPVTSPAIAALGEILFMGRSAKVNVIGIAQMLTARAIGGPEARENFGIRCLARYSANAWKMLVPEAAMPRASRTRGRWQVVVGGEAREVQVAYLSNAQARALAVSPLRERAFMASDQGMSPGQPVSRDMPVDPLTVEMTLRQAVDCGYVHGKYEAAKKRLQRDRRTAGDRVPPVVGQRGQADLFRAGDLIAWSMPADVQ